MKVAAAGELAAMGARLVLDAGYLDVIVKHLEQHCPDVLAMWHLLGQAPGTCHLLVIDPTPKRWRVEVWAIAAMAVEDRRLWQIAIPHARGLMLHKVPELGRGPLGTPMEWFFWRPARNRIS